MKMRIAQDQNGSRNANELVSRLAVWHCPQVLEIWG